MKRARRRDTVVGDVIEDHVFARTRGEIVDGLEDLICGAVPFERGMKRNGSIVAKRAGDEITIRRRGSEGSGVDAMRQLTDASLALQAMQHVQDGAAVRVFSVAVARLF